MGHLRDASEGWPNTVGQGAAPGLLNQSFTPTSIDVAWFDTPPNGGDGTWTLARFTLENLTPGWLVTASGAHTSKNYGGTLIPWAILYPEPGTLSLLAVAGLAALIRRR